LPQPSRYRAFISYSHDDERWARWLGRALENYKLPKSLRAKHPEMPARLYPIFRDRDELASSTDLSESIQRAMDDSEALIVVCSPRAAKSEWVNEEVRRFREARGGARIFCLLVRGSPRAGAEDCAFPPALLQSRDGEPAHEPLAADVTPGGDGKRNAMLKIAAGLLGVGVDELKRRYAQRQARLWATVAAGSLAVAVVTIGLAVAAFVARQESEIRRKQGEKLIGFMLGDLRNKLEPIGKLDVLDAVGDQAMSYFAALGRRGTPQEMLARAKALRQIGDVRFNQGHLEPALQAFQKSLDQALALHQAQPDNNGYLFELGQAEFWVGYVAWQRNELAQAHASMEKYMRYSKELSDRAPDNAAYRMELAYAHNNLGSVAKAQGHPEEALTEFRQAAAISEAELKSRPGDAGAISDLAEIWSWISSTLQNLGRLQESEAAATRAADLMRGLHEQGKDARASARYADYLLLLADAELRLGQVAAATTRIESTRAIYKGLLATDPSNTFWRQNALVADYYLVAASEPDQWTPQLRQLLDATAGGLQALADKDPTNKTILAKIASVDRLRALGALAQGNAPAALESARRAHEVMQKLAAGKNVPVQLKVAATQIEETLGAATLANGDRSAAVQIWTQALAALDKETGDDLAVKALQRLLAADLGNPELAAQLSQQLAKAGFDDPRFEPNRDERH
jgi:tetratricopeptide (TPR) repeat protein